MGIDDRLVLPGFLPDPHRYIGLFDIFALSSQSEQFPISVIEAMAAGLPVVAPPVGDVAAMVAPENAPFIAAAIAARCCLRDAIAGAGRAIPTLRRSGRRGEPGARRVREYDEAAMIARYARALCGGDGPARARLANDFARVARAIAL